MSTKVASLYAEIGADTSKLEQGLKKAKGGLEEFKGESKRSASSFSEGWKKAGLVIGGVTTAIGVAKLAFDKFMEAGKAGAELEYTAQKFDRLAMAAGTTATVLEKDLKDATKGLVSDAELVGSASAFMALGLAKSHDEVVRLTRVAGALGMNMNQLVLTLTNQTTMRFDALGVSVDGFDEKLEALKKSGMDTNQAFTEAFLQQAEAQIKKVGERSDSTVAAFDRLDVASKNLGDTLKQKLAGPAASTAEALADLLNGVGTSDKQQQQIEKLRTEIENSSKSYRDYIEQMIDAGISSGKLKEEYRDLVNVWDNPKQLETLIDVVGAWTEAEYNAITTSRDLTEAVKDQEGRWRSFKPAVSGATEATKAAISPVQSLSFALEGTTKQMDGYTDGLPVAMSLTRKLGENSDAASGKVKGIGNSADFAKSRLDILNGFNLNLADTIQDELDRIKWSEIGGPALEQELKALPGRLKAGLITEPQYQAELKEIEGMAVVAQGKIDGLDATQTSQALADQLGIPFTEADTLRATLETNLNAMTMREWVIQMRVDVTGYPPAGGGSGTWVPEMGIPGDVTPPGKGKNKQGGKSPNFASGGILGPGMWGTVGEAGTEAIYSVPGGGVQVFSHGQSQGMGGNTIYAPITINTLPGQSPQAIASAVLAQMARGNRRGRAGAGYAGA